MTWREDKTLLTLAFFTVFFTVVVLAVVWLRPNDGQTFQTFVTMMAGFAGGLTLHLKGEKAPPPGSTTATTTTQVTEIPPAAKP
jgi:hypothetical protein